MNLNALTRTVQRHKLATIPVILLAVLGVGYVGFVKAPVYQAQSTYILVPGAAPPTSSQLAKNPALNRLNSSNPFEAYGDISIVGDMLVNVMSSPSEAAVLAGEGASGSFTVAPDTTTYGTSPIIEITAEGATAAVASHSAALVGVAMQKRLEAAQEAQGTSRQYWIGLLELAPPDHPQAQLSSKLRDLVAVIAAAVILLFVIVSVLTAREERKRESLPADPAGEANGWPHHSFQPTNMDFMVPPGHGVPAPSDQMQSEFQRGQQDPRYVDGHSLNRLARRRWHGGISAESTTPGQEQSASRHPD